MVKHFPPNVRMKHVIIFIPKNLYESGKYYVRLVGVVFLQRRESRELVEPDAESDHRQQEFLFYVCCDLHQAART